MCDRIAGELLAGRPVLLNTTGRSMEPLLRAGKTQVLVSPVTAPVRVGDLPLVQAGPGIYRLHRVIRTEGDLLVTRGDNSILKETVPADQVLGTVREICREGGSFSVDHRGYRLYWRLWLGFSWLRIPIYHLRGSIQALREKGNHHGA